MAEYREEPSLPSHWDFVQVSGGEPEVQRQVPPKIAAKNTYTVTVELPKDFFAWIGRVTVQWANLQWQLSGIACRLLGVRRQDAQILLDLPDRELPNKILRLFSQKQLRAPGSFPALAALLRECERAIATLQNGVWIRERETEQLRVLHPIAEKKLIRDALGKAQQSELHALTPEWFLDLQSKLDRAGSAIQEVDQYINQPVARDM